ncbi:hypothetical protein C8R45DRAFT_1077588 [Mycena sanguinolenta]|nr:hypothetical protein C8R45DRAFT_1077588 [Mycena sanguinolenta]
MKATAITALLAASLATAEVTWTFQKFENGVEVPFTVGPQTKFQSQAMAKVGEARQRNRLNGRASGVTVQSGNWCGAALVRIAETKTPFEQDQRPSVVSEGKKSSRKSGSEEPGRCD